MACGPPGLTGGRNVLYHNRGDGTFEDVSDAVRHHARERHLRPRRQHARLRQRRLDRRVRRERFEPERALPQQPRRHVHRHRRRRRLRLQPGRQAAGRHGRRHRRLRPQRHDGHLQDELRRRHVDALRQHRRRLLRGPDVRRRDRRSTRAGSGGASGSSISTTTAGSTVPRQRPRLSRRSSSSKTEAGYKQRKVVYRNLGNGRFADVTERARSAGHDAEGRRAAPRSPTSTTTATSTSSSTTSTTRPICSGSIGPADAPLARR